MKKFWRLKDCELSMIDHNPVWRTRQVANNFADTRLLLLRDRSC